MRERSGLEVNWRFFSLEEINRQDGKKHPSEREWSYGWSMMRIGALLRRQSMADHQRVVDAGGYGVPTLFFPDGQCLFGPVLIDLPAGEAALRLWDAVVAWTEFPHLYELQRPKTHADQQAITETCARIWRPGTGCRSTGAKSSHSIRRADTAPRTVPSAPQQAVTVWYQNWY